MSASDNVPSTNMSVSETTSDNAQSSVSAPVVSVSEHTYIGRVKRFNKKSGYGFIEILSNGGGQLPVGTDVFVHHSHITVEPQGIYRYLNVNESVVFKIGTTDSQEHPHQAVEVRCSGDGKLNCENSAVVGMIRASRRGNNTGRQGQSQDGGNTTATRGFYRGNSTNLSGQQQSAGARENGYNANRGFGRGGGGGGRGRARGIRITNEQ
jgi:cold shock CspA family protein